MPSPSEHSAAVRSGPAWPQLALVLLPVLAFYGLLLRFYTAVPLLDDYWHMIVFALQWHGAAGAGTKLGLVMHTQVGPYKLIFIHALLGLQLAVFGKLNFPGMIWLGNLMLLGIFALLCKCTPRARSDKYPFLVLLPVSLLLFSLNYAETVDWAVIGLQEPGVILFSLAAVYFLVKPGSGVGQRTRDFGLACGFALLASATYANGVLVFPVGLLFLLLAARRLGGGHAGWPWGRLLVWSACFGASLYLYLSHSTGSGISARAPIARQAVFLLSFCGGGLENMHHRPVPYLSVVIGMGVVAAVLLSVRTRYDRRNPFFFYAMAWLMLTAIIVANARVALGLQLALSGRYKIFCDLLLIFCYEYGLDRYRQRRLPERERRGGAWERFPLYLGAWTLAAMIFCLGSDAAGGEFLATRKQRAETAMRGYLADPRTGSPMFLVEETLGPSEVEQEDLARRELNEAVQTGIYTPPSPKHLGLF